MLKLNCLDNWYCSHTLDAVVYMYMYMLIYKRSSSQSNARFGEHYNTQSDMYTIPERYVSATCTCNI